MSRARSCSSTIRRRAPGSALMGDAEMVEHPRRHVDNPRGWCAGSDREHRHLGVARLERAVAAATHVMATAEIRELDSGSRRDDEVAGVRVGQRGPGALERVGLSEEVGGASGLPPARRRCEAELLAVLPGYHGPVFSE